MLKKSSWLLIFTLMSLILAGCVPPKKIKPAPVADGWRMPAASRNAYVVQKGDTLYSIAWAFGKDYRDLAQANHLAPPYALHSGQKIYISSHALKPQKHLAIVTKAVIVKGKTVTRKISPPKINETVANHPIGIWLWPTAGKVVAGYNNKLGGNKGVNIAGKFGTPVLASAGGRVVYSGTGIHSYGNLIIIKHNDSYLSAYAYNSKILIHEGQMVVAGQHIAAMGKNDAGKTLLHFEIRRNGKPVNPLILLRKKV